MTTATAGKKNPKYKWEVLALLWVAYLLNQADRQVFNVVLPLIREDLGLSDVAIGSIATVFNLFYALLVPIAGLVGETVVPLVMPIRMPRNASIPARVTINEGTLR